MGDFATLREPQRDDRGVEFPAGTKVFVFEREPWEHAPTLCGCKYLGNDAWSCGHIDGEARPTHIGRGDDCVTFELFESDFQYVPRCVNVYSVSRHYGGPEEGGWYFNRSECVCTVPLLDGEDPQKVIEFLKPRFENEGSIYSVLGGTLYEFAAERTAGQSDDSKQPRPHYE